MNQLRNTNVPSLINHLISLCLTSHHPICIFEAFPRICGQFPWQLLWYKLNISTFHFIKCQFHLVKAAVSGSFWPLGPVSAPLVDGCFCFDRWRPAPALRGLYVTAGQNTKVGGTSSTQRRACMGGAARPRTLRSRCKL